MDPYKKAHITEELKSLKDAGLYVALIILPGIGLALLTSVAPAIGGPISAVVLGALLAGGLYGERERRERDRQLAQEFEKAHPNWKVSTR